MAAAPPAPRRLRVSARSAQGGATAGTGSRTWGPGGTWRPVLPTPPPGMERRRAPADSRRYGQRRFWDERYRREGAEPREWLGGLSRFLPQLQPELRPGDRILVLGTCPLLGGSGSRPRVPAARGRWGRCHRPVMPAAGPGGIRRV